MIAVFIITVQSEIFLSSSAPTQLSDHSGGGSKVRRSCQSSIVGAVCTELHHSDRNLTTA